MTKSDQALLEGVDLPTSAVKISRHLPALDSRFGKLPTVQIMTVEQWLDVPTHPLQRDTERHAERIKSALQEPVAPHAVVAAIRLPGGRMFKVDGHTRALLWLKGLAPSPRIVTVIIYDVETDAEISAIYIAYDNPLAQKTSSDNVSGAYRKHNFNPTSAHFRAAKIHASLVLAEASSRGRAYSPTLKKARPEDLLPEWIAECAWLDELLTGHSSSIPSGIIAAALITRDLKSEMADQFWRRFIGREQALNTAPWLALHSAIKSARDRRQMAGRENQVALCGCALSAFDAFCNGRPVKSLRPTAPHAYYAKHRAGAAVPESGTATENS